MVLATALEIIDRDWVHGLSMRRLGHALDRDPMVLHRHAPNKAALLDGVAAKLTWCGGEDPIIAESAVAWCQR